MASIYELKPKFQALLRPLVKSLAKRGITANQVTIAAVVLSLGTGLVLLYAPGNHEILLLVPIVMFIRMALNAIDGMLASEHAMKSNLGAILNELGDVIADAGLFLPFALLDGVNTWLVVLFVIGAIITEMTGVIAIQIGAERRYDGPLGKSDRAFAFGAIALILGVGVLPTLWVNGLLLVGLGMIGLTVWNRASGALAAVAAKGVNANGYS